MEMELSVFNKGFLSEYQYEGLPLNDLKINNETINSTNCQSGSSSWLSCRRANISNHQVFKPERCQNEINLNLTYTVDHLKEFENEKVSIEIKNFQKKIKILCNN